MSRTASIFRNPQPKLISPSGIEIFGHRASIPGEFSNVPVPMLQVEDLTIKDYENDLNFDRFVTTIWYRSRRGETVARRMASDLAETGVAILWPFDRDVLIHAGEKHHIIKIGAAAAKNSDAEGDDDDAGDQDEA